MAWLAVHPGLTEKLRIPEAGPEFELQFWPPFQAAKFEIASGRIAKEMAGLDLVKDFDRISSLKGLDYRTIAEMVRWGVRGWAREEGGEACLTEEAQSDGRTFTVLTEASVEVLRVNRLLYAVAVKCGLYNRLTPEQKKTSTWRSDSSGRLPGTNATSAIPISLPAPTAAESSSSTEAPSKDARIG